MICRIARSFAILLGLCTGVAGAQVQVKVTSVSPPGGTATIWDPPGSTYGALYVSPYGGTIVGTGQNLVLNCVDFFHTANLGRTYWANQTYLSAASLANTRFDNLQWYLQSAWLTQQYNSPDPGANDNRRIAIQAAIWNIFTPAAPNRDWSSNSDPRDQDYWLYRARMAANWQAIDPADFYVLTPTNKDYAGSSQEFLVYNPSAVPEPATVTLMATGMVGLALAARRRRSKREQGTG